MAKLKTDTGVATEANAVPIISEETIEMASEGSVTQETTKTDTSKSDPIVVEKTAKEDKVIVKSTNKPVSASKIESYIDSVLKAYPNCKELYVDAHGGAFTTDTAQVIRKGAKLYKNPHYQS